MSRRIQLTVLAVDASTADRLNEWPLSTRLREVVAGGGYYFDRPLPPDLLDQRLEAFSLDVRTVADADPAGAVYTADGAGVPAAGLVPAAGSAPGPRARPLRTAARPESLTDAAATRSAYFAEIERAASLLRANLSVLVICDKICATHLAAHIVEESGRDAVVVDDRTDQAPEPLPGDGPDVGAAPAPAAPPAQPNLRTRLLARIRDAMFGLTDQQVLVIKHLDLLAGGAEATLSNEARDLIEQLYTQSDRVILGFSDPTLKMPEVLAARFAARIALEGTARVVLHPVEGTPQPVERALVLEREAERFRGFDREDFYKYVAGLNPVVLRQAMRYAYQETEGRGDAKLADLKEYIRTFKVQTSSNFEIPNVSFDQIGGYADVKAKILRDLRILTESHDVPEEDRGLSGELVPHGFIFHGDPGTGKTLFAKAIANAMVATILVVSGPEVTNKYVGESERRVRELFAEARRNAPSVIVFDEFDAIAASRSSWDDGGSRAGNAMVAQILTEMDGFRPGTQMLVIGTTNRLEIIDKALLRPSRFSTYHIPLPDPDARREIIAVHAKRYHIDAAGLVDQLVQATDHWNGDEIRALFSEAYTGKHWEGIEPDAHRLGELVGQIQRDREKRQESTRGRA